MFQKMIGMPKGLQQTLVCFILEQFRNWKHIICSSLGSLIKRNEKKSCIDSADHWNLLKDALDVKFTALRTEVAALKTEVKTEVAALRTEVAAVRTEVATKTEVAALQTEVAAVKTEVAAVQNNIMTAVNKQISALQEGETINISTAKSDTVRNLMVHIEFGPKKGRNIGLFKL